MAPHARAPISLARIQAIRLLALVPVLIAAVINTGHQYLSALNAIGGIDEGDWRDGVVRSLRLDYSDPTMLDVLAAGLSDLAERQPAPLDEGGEASHLRALARSVRPLEHEEPPRQVAHPCVFAGHRARV